MNSKQALLATILLLSFCSYPKAQMKPTISLDQQIRRFAPAELTADITRLSPGDRKALQKLIAAARIMDNIYLRQAWNGNPDLRKQLANDKSPEGLLRIRYFDLNMGPWSKLDNDKPFIEGVPRKPIGANFYPEDMRRSEFSGWFASLSDDDQKKANGFFHVIRRNAKGKFTLVPYSEEYKKDLVPAAKLLREAARLTDNASLKKFLTLRADAFLTNDYYASDIAWMELDSPIEPTIGPYEVYMDEVYNYKAAFEAYITIRNDEETAKLGKFSAHLQEIEDTLPIDPKYRNPRLGALAPLRVVDEVFTGGEARAGVQTAAFNLPNDERVTNEKGSKRVMLKNVQEAKFRTILLPIAEKAIDPSQRPLIAFEPFFTHILMHEVMHGLGPHSITVNGRVTTVRQQMGELSSAFEEAKADIAGLFALQYLIDKGVIDKSVEQQMYVTFLAGVFRSVRFGINEAHGKGMAMQFNYLCDEGAFDRDSSSGSYGVNFAKVKDAVRKLSGEIMTIQAEGSQEKARAMLDKYGVLRPDLQFLLDNLYEIPVDIAPTFPLAK